MFDNINGFVPNSPDPEPNLNGHHVPEDGSFSDLPEAHYSPLSGISGGPETTMDAVSAPDSGEEPAGPADDFVHSLADVEPTEEVAGGQALEAVEVEAQAVVDEPLDVEAAADVTVEDRSLSDDVVEAPEEGTLEPDPSQPLTVGRPSSPLELDAQIESLLFVADGPAPVGKLAEALEVSVSQIEAALAHLDERYAGRGIAIQRIKDRVQLTTAPTAAAIIQRFLGLSATAPLSKAALETLAIIAYRQPITRPQIEQIRGVNSDSVIKNLLTKGLVEEAGIAEGPGRPVLYTTTPEFLQHFGLSTLSELPVLNLDELRRQFASELLKG